jgi:hypothetical protein
MFDAGEWAWIEGRATGGFDHLLLGTSLPLMLGPGMHHLQAWNEKLCSGAWGRRAAKWAEDLRRSQDLDHWASFHASFGKMVGTIRSVVAGERGAPPSTVLVLSGDVHHGYLAEASLNGAKPVSRVYQPSAPPSATPSPARSRASSPRPGAGAPPAPEARSPAWPA